MPRLDDAQRRIEQALDRLEATTQARKETGSGESAQLAKLRADHEALKETTEAVSARLDAVIGRLKAVLES